MNLALLSQSEGNYQEAYDLYRKALAIEESALGPNSMRVASTLGNMGFLLRVVGEYTEALEVLTRSLRISEETLGLESPELLNALTNLGYLCRDMGRPGEAVGFWERVVDINRETFSGESARIGAAKSNLAGALNDLGQFQQALLPAREAAEIGARYPDAILAGTSLLGGGPSPAGAGRGGSRRLSLLPGYGDHRRAGRA
jgi:tetratricopeptide (TPR) repeat protein